MIYEMGGVAENMTRKAISIAGPKYLYVHNLLFWDKNTKLKEKGLC